MENAAIYARVSSVQQLDNTSLQAQTERCRAYCTARGYSVVEERRETESGALVLARSKYNELLEQAADGLISVFVVDIPDRLGRGDAIAKLELMAQLNGARVEYAQPGRDTSTIEGLVQHSAEQMVSGIERLNIRRRTMSGKRDLAMQGRIIATRYRPYGYRFVSEYDARGRKTSCKLEIVETEARVIRMMFEWMVYEGLTLYSIAIRLTEMGVPTMTGIPKWRREALGKMLRNRTYIGEWHYGKRDVKRVDTPEGAKQHFTLRDMKDTVVVPCLAIVDKELFGAAQKQLELNVEKFKRPAKYQYLLRGRIECARCHARFNGSTPNRGRGRPYYICHNAVGRLSMRHCEAKAVRAEVIEGQVWNVVCEKVRDETRMMEGYRKRRNESAQARRAIELSIAASQGQISKLEERLTGYEEMCADKLINRDKFMGYKADIDDQIDKLRKEQADWRRRLGELPDASVESEEALLKFRRAVIDRLTPDTPFEGRLKVIEMLDIRCIYNDETGELSISGLLGDHTLSIKSRCGSRLVRHC